MRQSQEREFYIQSTINSEFSWNDQSCCSNSLPYRLWSVVSKGIPKNNAAIEVRLLGKWSSSTEGLSKITKGKLPKQDWFSVHSARANPIMHSRQRKRGEHGSFAQVCSFESLSAQERVVTCDVCIWWHKMCLYLGSRAWCRVPRASDDLS